MHDSNILPTGNIIDNDNKIRPHHFNYIDGGAGPITAWKENTVHDTAQKRNNFEKRENVATDMNLKKVIETISNNLFDAVELSYDDNNIAIISFHPKLKLYEDTIISMSKNVADNHSSRFTKINKSITNLITNEKNIYVQIIDNWGGYRSHLYDEKKVGTLIKKYINILQYISKWSTTDTLLNIQKK